MVLATKPTPANSQLVPNHAYAVVGFDPGPMETPSGGRCIIPGETLAYPIRQIWTCRSTACPRISAPLRISRFIESPLIGVLAMSRAILPALLTAILFPTEAGARRPPFGQSVFIGEVHNGAFPDHLHFGAKRGNRFVQAKLAIPRPVRTHPNQWLAGMHRVDDYANYGLDWAPDRRKVDFSLFFSGDPNFDGSGGNALFTWGSDHYRLGSGDVFPIYDELYLATIHATPVVLRRRCPGRGELRLGAAARRRPEHGVGPRRGKSTRRGNGPLSRAAVSRWLPLPQNRRLLQRQRHRDAGRGRGPGDRAVEGGKSPPCAVVVIRPPPPRKPSAPGHRLA